MESGTVKNFCDTAALLLPALVQLAAVEGSQRSPEDDAMVRQLRVAAGAIAHALMEVPRQQPPLPTSPNVGASP